MYKLKMQLSKKQFIRLIKKDVENIQDEYRKKIQIAIHTGLYLAIADMLHNTDIWQDFEGHGPLWKRLGGGNLTTKLEQIIQHWSSNIDIIVIPDGLRFVMIKADYSDVLELDAATFESITTRPGPYRGQKHKIEWLRWLLLEGRKYVVKEYIFTEKLSGKRGGGLMIPKKGAGWRIPEAYAGTIEDNFLTRAIDEYLDKIIDDINKDIGNI